jgi:hypothetical protein
MHYLPDQYFTHGFFEGAFLKEEKAAKLDLEIQLLLNALSGDNLDFELLHRDALENFAVSGNKVVNRLTGQEFSVLVLPLCDVLSIRAARLCRELVRAGRAVYPLFEG